MFNPSMFCEQLGQRKLVFIGDSTMQQTATTVMNAIMWDGDGLSQKCAKQVVAVSSDTLTGKGYVIKGSGYPKGKQGTKGWFRGITFQKAIDQERPDIAVITANAHISQLQDFKAMLAEVAA